MRGVDGAGEGGLLGLALSPSYDEDQTVFAYFTAGDENVIARMTYDGNELSDQRTVFDGIPSGPIHNGGRIAFGPDGFLYVGTGEAGRRDPSQDPDDLGGKILRITADGRAGAGQPDRGVAGVEPGAPQRAGPRLGRARPDVGQRVRPEHLGRAEPDRARRQLRLAGGGGARGRQPVPRPGAAVAHRRRPPPAGSRWPAARCSWPGCAASGSGRSRCWSPASASRGALLAGRYGRLRAVAAAPDGSLWVLTNNTDGRGSPRQGDDRIIRLDASSVGPPSTSHRPPSAQFTCRSTRLGGPDHGVGHESTTYDPDLSHWWGAASTCR